MALVFYWYDFVCFAIVVAASAASLWVIWRKERQPRHEGNRTYASLLVGGPDTDVGFEQTRLSNRLNTAQLWTSCWRGVHPGWLLVTRSVSLVTMGVFLSWDLVEWGAGIFVYYTEWTYALVMFYFALGTAFSAYGCWVCWNKPIERGGQTPTADSEEELPVSCTGKEAGVSIKFQDGTDEAGTWGHVMQMMYQACAGAVILTDLVFWCFIVPFLSNSHLGLSMLTGCMHSLNFVFLLLDTALNNLPFSWFRIAYFVLWSCLYVVSQWVLRACGFPWWSYPFLKLDTPWAPLWYFCMAIIHIPCYVAYALIAKTKYSILPRFFPHAFVKPY